MITIPPQLQILLAQRTKVQQVERTLVHRVVITLPHPQAHLVHDTRTHRADQILMAHRRRLVVNIRAPQETNTNARLCNPYSHESVCLSVMEVGVS